MRLYKGSVQARSRVIVTHRCIIPEEYRPIEWKNSFIRRTASAVVTTPTTGSDSEEADAALESR